MLDPSTFAELTPSGFPSGAVYLPNLVRDTGAWHVQRSHSVGASEVAMALGLSTHGGLLDLVLRKRAARTGDGGNDSPAMALGRHFEAAILNAGRQQWQAPLPSNQYIETLLGGALVRPNAPWLTASPDAVWYVNTYAEGSTVQTIKPFPVEAKHDRSGADWREFANEGPVCLFPGDLRASYWTQVQAQLLVTGCPFGMLVVYDGSTIHTIRIPADAEHQARIDAAARVAMQWVEHPGGALPAPSDVDSLRAIGRAIRADRKASDTDDEQVAAWVTEYLAAHQEEKRGAERKEAAKRRLLTRIAVDGVGGYRTAAGTATVSSIKGRDSVDVALLRASFPDAARACISTGEPSVQMRVTAPKPAKGAATAEECAP